MAQWPLFSGRGIGTLAAAAALGATGCSASDLEEAEDTGKRVAEESLEVGASDKMVGKALAAAEQGDLLAGEKGWDDLSDTEKIAVGGAPVGGNLLFRALQRQIEARAPDGQ